MKEFDNIPIPIERWDHFLSDVANTAERTVDIAINAFTNLTDTIATQLEQGEADWKEFGAAVLRELNRMIIGMILAETVYNNFLKPLWKGISLGSIKQEDPVGVGVAVAITTAGTAMSTAITASGSGVAGAIISAGHQAAAAIHTAAVGSSFAGLLGGGTSYGGTLPSGTYVSHALGAAYNAGKMLAFANGGIVGQPTIAPTALIGEAGPEAIMPLSRTASGELGVKATQPNINFNPQMKLILVRDEREAQLEAMRSSAGEKIIVQKVARNKNVLG